MSLKLFSRLMYLNKYFFFVYSLFCPDVYPFWNASLFIFLCCKVAFAICNYSHHSSIAKSLEDLNEEMEELRGLGWLDGWMDERTKYSGGNFFFFYENSLFEISIRNICLFSYFFPTEAEEGGRLKNTPPGRGWIFCYNKRKRKIFTVKWKKKI